MSIHWKIGHRRFQLALHVIFFLVLVLYWKCTHSKILLSNTKFLLTFSKIVTSFVMLHTSTCNTHVILSKFLLVHQKYLYNVSYYKLSCKRGWKYFVLSYNRCLTGPRHEENFTLITNNIYENHHFKVQGGCLYQVHHCLFLLSQVFLFSFLHTNAFENP